MSEIEQLIEQYNGLKEKIISILDALPRAGNVCNCRSRNTFKAIHEGNLFDDMFEICIECGGYVETYE